ncbi:MAG: transcription-repair coupling factor [Candidatus Izimaplasma sp.]|nr:transcription-repair coupling factor [Candidatus Izimaplasma bacterium]
MKQILKYLQATPFYKTYEQQLKQQEIAQIKNSNDAINALLVGAYFDDKRESLVVVTPNIYTAQKVYERLVNVISEDQVTFFPQDEFMTTEMLAMSTEFKVERMNTVAKILEKKPIIVVTNTTGYTKELIPVDAWENAIIKLFIGKVIEVKQLVERLIKLGYQREDIVENQGDFSVRGSIVDIFPINQTDPIRIDFFDDEIDTIRKFDTETQRSSIKIKSYEIFPMYEFFYSDNTIVDIKQQVNSLKENFDVKSQKRIEEELEQLEHRHEMDNLYRYMTFVYDKQETISDYLNNNMVVFWDNKQIKDNYKNILHDITEWYQSTNDYPKLGFQFIRDIEHIYNGKTLQLDVFGDKNQTANALNVRSKEVTEYNGNIKLLIDDLKKYHTFTTTILTFQSHQKLIDFTKLIEDKVPYQIIGKNDVISPNQLNIIESDYNNPIEFFSINTILLSEASIFHKKQTKKAKFKSALKDTKKLSTVDELKKGDLIVHYDHGIGRFLGVKEMTLGERTNDYVHIAYKGDDSLYIPVENIHLIQKYVASEGKKPKINRLGGSAWAKTKQRVRKRVKNIADKLIKLYAEREQAEGFAFSQDTELQTTFEKDFPYIETDDQLTAVEDIKQDMEKPIPMDRLLCGDVGYGKTEVAMRAAFKAVLDNKQVAYLAPTTVLSRQHFYTFKERFNQYGIKIGLLNRFVTKAVQRQIIKQASVGNIDIIIGTHRLLSKDMHFHDLGLLIIDEEQRFGVEHKEIIKEMKVNIDVLSLSATPIPRTLQMAIMGVKNMSLLETPPLNRYPIQTYVLERNDAVIRDAIQREMARDGQIFYLYNRVDDIQRVTYKIQALCPDARVGYAHGKMSRLKLEEVINAFLDKEYDVLVSTTIIETGIDIPNANTLLVHDADRLGLAQLYQLRGRVGRSDRIAYAYLMYQKNKILTEEATKRLKVIKEFTELGSGFKIAMRDLSIRGAGDILGTEQSGFMDSVGIDLFLDMLKEEVDSRQSGEPIIEKQDAGSKIRLQVDKYIDTNYIQNDYVKIEMHKKIAKITSESDIKQLKEEFTDRFGEPSEEVILYMYEKLFEHLAEQVGIEEVRETKTNMTFTLSKAASNNINGDYLFNKANKISPYIRFSFRLNQLNITIDTVKLSKHYLYTIVALIQIM